MINFLISLYIFCSILILYIFPLQQQLLIFFSVLNGVIFMFFLYSKGPKIPKKIFWIMTWTGVCLVANFDMNSIMRYISNVVVMTTVYFLVRYKGRLLDEKLYLYASIFNIINVFLYVFGEKEIGSPKILFGYPLQKVILSDIGVASVSLIIIYSLMNVFRLKNKVAKAGIVISHLFLIFVFGKFSVIFALLIAYFLYFLFQRVFSERISHFFMRNIIILCSTSSLIYYYFNQFFSGIINLENLFSGRNVLWVGYIQYIFSNTNVFFFGGGFTRETDFFSHPHNQYLQILYIFGIFGFILYISFLLEVGKKVVQYRKEHKELLLLFMTLLIMMCGDDYFLITIFPIPLITFMSIFLLEDKSKMQIQ